MCLLTEFAIFFVTNFNFIWNVCPVKCEGCCSLLFERSVFVNSYQFWISRKIINFISNVKCLFFLNFQIEFSYDFHHSRRNLVIKFLIYFTNHLTLQNFSQKDNKRKKLWTWFDRNLKTKSMNFIQNIYTQPHPIIALQIITKIRRKLTLKTPKFEYFNKFWLCM